MSTETTTRPLRDTIPDVKLHRMDRDIAYCRHHPSDGPMLSRFSYDHSNTLVHDSKGRVDLLIPNTVPLASDIARLLQHISPAMVTELIHGYRLARAAGLLGDGRYNPETAQKLSPLVGKWEPHEHEAAGVRVMNEITETLRKANRQPGGIKLNDPPAKVKT